MQQPVGWTLGSCTMLMLASCTVPGCRSGTPPAAASKAPLRFERTLALETTSETSANVSLGDLDGDGNLDLVLAKGRHWGLVDRVLLGDGHGAIRAAYDLGKASDRSYSGALADLDGDGDLDVVISNDTPDPKLVYLNDGTGHFGVGSAFGQAEWETRNARVADMNNDGLPDIIVANRSASNSTNYVCLNRGAGRFDSDCIAVSHEPATTITPANMDRAGGMDLIVPYRDEGQSYVYCYGPGADFMHPRKIPFGPADAAFRMAEAADFNSDGVMDIVAIDERRGTAIYFGEAGGAFSSGLPIGGAQPAPYALAIADLDGNGRPDIVVGYIQAPSAAFFNDGSGRAFTPVRFGDSQGAVYGFAIGDLDRDGVLDIAAARSDAPNMVYFGGK